MAVETGVRGHEGMYGEEGWSEAAGLGPLLDPGGQGPGWGGITRFQGLTGEAAAAVRSALPDPQMRDRQNDGPELGALLAAAVEHPGEVLLSGYWVRCPREDERVSVDGVLLRGWALHAQYPSRDEVWTMLNGMLELGDCGTPDELDRWVFDDGTLGWWIWWD